MEMLVHVQVPHTLLQQIGSWRVVSLKKLVYMAAHEWLALIKVTHNVRQAYTYMTLYLRVMTNT